MHRKLFVAIAAVASLTLLAACGQEAETGGIGEPLISDTQDAVGMVVGATSAATLGSTTVDGFVTNFAIGDMYEIQSSRIALERAQNPAVRDLAQMLITDHTEASAKLKALVDTGQVTGVTLPTSMDQRRQGMVDNLRSASDEDFDGRYLDQQANAHREALILLNGYQAAGQNEALKTFSEEVEPRIELHLSMINEIDRGGTPANP